MKFSVAIICSNDILIEKCIKSIPEDTQIIVVLNFPSESVLKIVKNYPKIKTQICNEKNLGKLRQIAADICETPAICYVDSDCVLDKNLVNIVEKELDKSYAVNIPLHFDYYDEKTKTVSLCRRFTTPDNLLYMPFAFRLNIQDKIGKLFNDKLTWGEDSDQRQRIKENNLTYSISKSFVIHKALTPQEDINSAFRLGFGTFMQEQVLQKKRRSKLKDLSILREIIGAFKCYRATKSFKAALYHFFKWRPAYKSGYWRSRNEYKTKNKNNL